jgi:hypothetical protein
MKGTFTSIKKMRMPLVHQWRWLFVFLMLLSSLPGWTKDGNIKVTLNEKTLLNGSFYIETAFGWTSLLFGRDSYTF